MRYEWATIGDFDVCIDTRSKYGGWELEEVRARDSEIRLDDVLTETALKFFYESACDSLEKRHAMEKIA